MKNRGTQGESRNDLGVTEEDVGENKKGLCVNEEDFARPGKISAQIEEEFFPIVNDGNADRSEANTERSL